MNPHPPADPGSKRKLHLNLSLLTLAFLRGSAAERHYLDQETGDLISIPHDAERQYAYLLEAVGDDPAPEVLEAALNDAALPFDLREGFRDIRAVRQDSARYLEVPGQSGVLDIQDMSAFLDQVSDPVLSEQLEACFAGGGSLSHFQAILIRDRRTLDAWIAFRNARARGRVLKWLEGLGITPA